MYSEVNQDYKQLKIIYVSSDRDEETFLENFEEMPWLAINFSEDEFMQRLELELGVTALPHLTMLNTKLEVIDRNAREVFNEKGKDAIPHWIQLVQAIEDAAGAVPES
jgi:nucleoredoxin